MSLYGKITSPACCWLLYVKRPVQPQTTQGHYRAGQGIDDRVADRVGQDGKRRGGVMTVELKTEHSKAISSAIKKLNKTLDEVRRYVPEANFYLEDSNNFLTMSGASHDDNGKPRHDRVLQHDTLHHSGGGGW